MAVSLDSHSKYVNPMCGQNAEISNDKCEGCHHCGGDDEIEDCEVTYGEHFS